MTPEQRAELRRLAEADEVFLVHSCGDGEYRSDLVHGREAARRKVAEHMYFGTFEEAMEDPVAGQAVQDFDNPDEWGMDRSEWRHHGEQFWIGAMRVTEKIPVILSLLDAADERDALRAKVERYEEALKFYADKKNYKRPIKDPDGMTGMSSRNAFERTDGE